MLRRLCVIWICLVTLSAFGQSERYQVGTITAVKPHQEQDDRRIDIVRYDVSVKVGDTIYQVLYTPPLGASAVKYAAGRNLLVLVDERTLRYNDIAGQSMEVPIVSRKPSPDAKQSK
jgi:hypothetical protein